MEADRVVPVIRFVNGNRPVMFSAVYLFVRCLLGCLPVLQQENAVLRHQIGRIRSSRATVQQSHGARLLDLA